MAWSGDEIAAGAGGRGRLLASHADREQVIEVLKVAFVQDRITKDELDQRIGKVLASQTYDDLDILTADIPGALIRARPAEPARPDVSKKKLIRRTSAAVAGTGFVIAEAVALSHHLTGCRRDRRTRGWRVHGRAASGAPNTHRMGH
jgi:hypothetical protein